MDSSLRQSFRRSTAERDGAGEAQQCSDLRAGRWANYMHTSVFRTTQSGSVWIPRGGRIHDEEIVGTE